MSLCLCFWDSIAWSPGWLHTYWLARTGLELILTVLGMWGCTAMPKLSFSFLHLLIDYTCSLMISYMCTVHSVSFRSLTLLCLPAHTSFSTPMHLIVLSPSSNSCCCLKSVGDKTKQKDMNAVQEGGLALEAWAQLFSPWPRVVNA